MERDASGGSSDRSVWILRGAVVAVALVAAAISWAVTREDDPPAEAEAQSRVVDEVQLVEASAELGQPIYWSGPIAGTAPELEEVGEGGVRVRYAPEDEAGEAPAEVLTIGSYPLPDPAQALERFAARPGTVARRAQDGSQVFYDEDAPNSVYFADPSGGVQVEVYSPSAEEALQLALSGDVEPVK